MFFKTTYKPEQFFRQTSIDDLLLNNIFNNKPLKRSEVSTTRQFTTFIVKYPTNLSESKIQKARNINLVIETFLNNFSPDELYREFKIPKRKGGFRELVDPQPELKQLQRTLLEFLQVDLQILPHNAAHAFTPNRDCYTNATTHRKNKCFITLDIQDFFPSIDKQILTTALSQNAEIASLNLKIHNFIINIVKLALYKGSLPQGSPLSPFFSNLVMLVFDYKIQEAMQSGVLPRFTYTRYADDMCFSASAFPHIQSTLETIEKILDDCFQGRIKFKKSKTKILKNTNRCYITGIKLNKDYQATYGHENKKKLKLDLYNLFQAKINNTLTTEETMETLGRFAYMSRIEPDYARYLQLKLLKDFNSTERTIFKHFREYLHV